MILFKNKIVLLNFVNKYHLLKLFIIWNKSYLLLILIAFILIYEINHFLLKISIFHKSILRLMILFYFYIL